MGYIMCIGGRDPPPGLRPLARGEPAKQSAIPAHHHTTATNPMTTATVTIESVQQWTWDKHSPDHFAPVPVVCHAERVTFSALMDTARPTRAQIALREAIRCKISYRISKEIG